MTEFKFKSELSFKMCQKYSTYTLSHALKYYSPLVSCGLQGSRCWEPSFKLNQIFNKLPLALLSVQVRSVCRSSRTTIDVWEQQVALFHSPPPGAVKHLFFHQLSGDAVETRCCHCITGGILEVIEKVLAICMQTIVYNTHIIIGILHAPLALRIVGPLSHDALCYALNILAHTILVSALRVFLFLREGHVFLTLLHSSWLIHELVFCCWLAVWVQSHPCSCHTKQWQRSNHVYLSESECPVLRVSHHLSCYQFSLCLL